MHKNNQQSISGQIKTSSLLIGPSWNMNQMTLDLMSGDLDPFEYTFVMTAYLNTQTVDFFEDLSNCNGKGCAFSYLFHVQCFVSRSV